MPLAQLCHIIFRLALFMLRLYPGFWGSADPHRPYPCRGPSHAPRAGRHGAPHAGRSGAALCPKQPGPAGPAVQHHGGPGPGGAIQSARQPDAVRRAGRAEPQGVAPRRAGGHGRHRVHHQLPAAGVAGGAAAGGRARGPAKRRGGALQPGRPAAKSALPASHELLRPLLQAANLARVRSRN